MGHVRRLAQTAAPEIMKRLLVVTALVLMMAFGYEFFFSEQTGTGNTLTLAQPAPTPGEEVQNFDAESLEGEEFELSDRGTYVLTFWSSLNRSSAAAQPAFERLAQEFGAEEVSFAAVYVGGVPRKDYEAPYEVIKDSAGELTAMYNVKRVPRLFLIDDGEVVLAHDTYYEANEGEIRHVLNEILQEERR